jgi:hypothetical protein
MDHAGESEQRDMVPATAHGIYVIHYAEAKSFSLDAKNQIKPR